MSLTSPTALSTAGKNSQSLRRGGKRRIRLSEDTFRSTAQQRALYHSAYFSLQPKPENTPLQHQTSTNAIPSFLESTGMQSTGVAFPPPDTINPQGMYAQPLPAQTSLLNTQPIPGSYPSYMFSSQGLSVPMMPSVADNFVPLSSQALPPPQNAMNAVSPSPSSQPPLHTQMASSSGSDYAEPLTHISEQTLRLDKTATPADTSTQQNLLHSSQNILPSAHSYISAQMFQHEDESDDPFDGA